MSFTAEPDPQGGCPSRILQGSSMGPQQWGRPCQIHHTGQGKQDASQELCVKTTLKLSPFFFFQSFFQVSGCSDFWGFYGCAGNWMILCGNENVIPCEKVTINCQQFLSCTLQSQIPERWLKPRATPADTWGKSLMVSRKLQTLMLATHQSAPARSWPIKAR